MDIKVSRSNCYEVVFELIEAMPEARIVHGRPVYRGPEHLADPDGRYCHAWVEQHGVVFDLSHGREFIVDVDTYYALGGIEPEKVRKYDRDAALGWIIELGHWGPWEQVTGLEP